MLNWRSAGTWGDWIFGVLEFGTIELLEYRSLEILSWRTTGIWKYWIVGVLEFGILSGREKKSTRIWGYWIEGVQNIGPLNFRSREIWGYGGDRVLEFGEYWIVGVLEFGNSELITWTSKYWADGVFAVRCAKLLEDSVFRILSCWSTEISSWWLVGVLEFQAGDLSEYWVSEQWAVGLLAFRSADSTEYCRMLPTF